MANDTTLRQEIDTFLARTGMAKSTFGRLAVNDGKFVDRIRAGSRCWPETAEKVCTFMTAHSAVPASAESAA